MNRVIVVSGNEAWARQVLARIAHPDLEVHWSRSGEQAIDAFVQQPSEALIIELDLPGRDGAATVESIRWAPEGQAAQVVLVGVESEPKHVEQVALELGARAVPSGDPARIHDALRTLLAPLQHAPLTGDVTKPAIDEELLAATRATTAEIVAPGADEGHEVEARAKILQKMARLEGTLEEASFAIIIARLGEQRATGALLLVSAADPRSTTTGESPKKVVFFRNGIPLHVRSNLVEECLGQVLLRHGWIERDALERSLVRVEAGAGRQGAVLVAMGELTPQRLREALILEQREKLFDLFAWPTGQYRFSEEMRPPGETVTLEMSMAEMVYRGISERVPSPRTMDVLHPFLAHYPMPLQPRLAGMEQWMTEDIAPMFALVDGTHSTRELLSAARSKLDAARWLQAAHALGAIAFRPRPSTPSVAKSTAHRKPSADLRSEVRRLSQLLGDGQYAVALAVTEGDGRAAGQAATQLEHRLREALEGPEVAEDIRVTAIEVLARLPRAALMVGGDYGRTSVPPPYPSTPPQLLPAPEPQPNTANAGHASAGSASARHRLQPAGTAQLPQAREDESSAHIDTRAPSEPAPPMRGHSSATPRRSSEDLEPPDDVSAVDSTGPMRARTIHPPPTVRDLPPHPPATVADEEPEADLDERVERMLRAERVFRRGCRALRREALDRALEAFEEAVCLAPDEGEFLMHRGWARVRTGDDTGLDDLRTAARRVPKMERAHLWLARALRDAGKLPGARDAYGNALAVNPESEEALRELKALGLD